MFDRPDMTERERRAYNRGLEHAAKLCQLRADEHWLMLHGNLLSDRILMQQTTPGTLQDDVRNSNKLIVEAHGISSRAHEAQDITKAVRELKVK
ncbi:MAG: hypothetical protein RIC14_05515 [Filomicrobium sp.]